MNHMSLLLLFVVPLSFCVSAEVFKCTDSAGKVTYQETPCMATNEKRMLVSNEQRVSELRQKLEVVEKRIQKKHPSAFPSYKESDFDRCRTEVGLRTKNDLSANAFVEPQPEVVVRYETCLEGKAIEHAKLESKIKADIERDSKERQARRDKPFPSIGMSESEVRTGTMLGPPKSVNTTVTTRGRSEQWVYGNGTYLYFENGTLTAIQTR